MKRIFLTITGIALFANVGLAREIDGLPKPNATLNANGNNSSLKTVEELCVPSKSQSDLNINNVRATILGGGDMWWDLNVARYEVPKGSNKHSMFAGALWLGGVDEGNQLKLAAMTYRQGGNDYWPGPLSTDGTANVTKDVCDKYDRHWLIYRDEVEIHKAWLDCRDDPDCEEGVVFPGYESSIPPSILDWPGNGEDGTLPYMLAPYVDRDQDGFYDPFFDYPAYDLGVIKEDCRLKETDLLYGDQTLWWVYNDRGNVHSQSQASALGFEIRAQAFAFSTNDEVNNMTFNNYRILNKSTFRLTNTYFSTWFDPDLGNANDDIIGCDIARGLGYCYNGDADDDGARGYGLNPPAIGFDFFQGPFADYFDGLDNDRDGCVDGVRNDEGICEAEDPSLGINERIIMSQFMYYNNAGGAVKGDPTNAAEFYNYMRARWRNGFPLVIDDPDGPGGSGNGDGYRADGSGTPTRYAYPGNSYDTTGAYPPTAPVNWFESPDGIADKRGLHSAGPFSLAPGALNFITVGAVWERDLINSNLFASVDKVIVADDKAQKLFDNCFNILNGPDAPDVTIQELDNELILQLSYRSSSNNYKFQYREIDPIIPDPVLDSGQTIGDFLKANPNYFSYVFEGFQIFQMANSEVSISDIYDNTQARLVAQCDVRNEHTQLINWTVDPNLNQLVPQDMTLESNNDGIFMSFRIAEDAFATANRELINHKEYYYTVIAYGVNQYEVFDPTTAPGGQRIPFLAGRSNISTYTGIPHLPNAEANGTTQNAEYGDGPEITRIEGRGNGGVELELKPELEEEIVKSFKVDPTYLGGMGPVDIKVVDPLAVPKGEYILSFTRSDDKSKWEIKDEFGVSVAKSDTTLEFFNEQIIAELGLSVTIEQPAAPGGDDDGIRMNGVINSEIVYSDPSRAWWRGVADDKSYTPFNWILAGANDVPTEPPAEWYPDFSGDSKGFFEDIVDGTWGPVAYASNISRQSYPTGTVYGLGPVPTGVTSPSNVANAHSIDVVITDDPSKWTRVPVLELSEDVDLSEFKNAKLGMRGDTSYSISNGVLTKDLNLEPGWSYFPGYAIDVETGDRLNMAFGENSWLKGENGADMRWNPTDVATIVPGDNITGGYVFGGQHYIYVFSPERRQGLNYVDNGYKGDDPTANPLYNEFKTLNTNGQSKSRVWGTAMWVSIPLLRNGFEFDPYSELPTETRFRIRMVQQYSNKKADPSPNDGNPQFGFSTGNISVATNQAMVAESALDLIRVVPNPYYGFSKYETSQLENTVKITNLPPRCAVSIYNTNGGLVRQIKKDNSDTFVTWDLRNQYNVPISSGIYIIHIDAGDAGEKVIKWFGALRPVDLNSF